MTGKTDRFRIEHHKADIKRKRRFDRAADDTHLPPQFFQSQTVRACGASSLPTCFR